LQAGFDHGAFGICIGCKIAESPTQFIFGVAKTRFECLNELVALPVERRCDLGQTTVESLRACIADMREAFGKRAFRFAREDGDSAFELPRKSARRVFARLLDQRCELLCRLFGESDRGSLERTFDLFKLTTLHVAEPGLESLCGFRLVAFDLLRQVTLAATETVFELVQGAPSLDGLRVELRLHRAHRFLKRTLNLCAKADDRFALLLAFGLKSLTIGCDPSLGIVE
jgi:hypothetical protein